MARHSLLRTVKYGHVLVPTRIASIIFQHRIHLLTIGRQQNTRSMFLCQRIVRNGIHRRSSLPFFGDTKKQFVFPEQLASPLGVIGRALPELRYRGLLRIVNLQKAKNKRVGIERRFYQVFERGLDFGDVHVRTDLWF